MASEQKFEFDFSDWTNIKWRNRWHWSDSIRLWSRCQPLHDGKRAVAAPNSGSWTVTSDSGVADQSWIGLTWTESTPSDSTLVEEARSSVDGATFSAFETASKSADLMVPDGQYLQVRVSFGRASTSETPVLFDLSILC